MSNLKGILSLAVFRLVGTLPLSWARRLGSLLGRIGALFDVRMAKVTRENIGLCLPHLTNHQAQQLALKSLRETGKTAAEICSLWRSKGSPLQFVCDIEGEDLVKSAYAQGKGLIVLAPHLGNWEMLGHYLETIGHVTNLYQPPKIKALEPLIQKSRAKAGCELVPADVKGVAKLLKHLKSGGISGILPDQNPNDLNSGEFAPFFGEPALTMTLVHKLLQRTKCAAVFAFAKRVEHGFVLVFRKAPEELFSADAQVSLAALNEGIQSLVKEAPEQYQWEYKRFKFVDPSGQRRYS